MKVFLLYLFCSLEFTGDGQAHFRTRFARYYNLMAYLTRRNLCWRNYLYFWKITLFKGLNDWKSVSIIQYQNICSLVWKIRVYELSLSRCYITLRCLQQNHNNIFYFVKRQMMLTWGQNSIKVPFRFRKLYLEKNILLLSSFSLSVLYICFCMRFISLLVQIKLCLWTCDTWCSLRARNEKAPAILSLGQRVTATVHAHHTIRTSSKHQKWEHPVKREKKGVLKRLERFSNKFTANANGNIYLSPRLILL